MRICTAFLMLMTWVAPTVADTQEEVRCREIGFSKSVEARDRQAFTSYIDPDARFVSGSVLRGPEAVTAAWSVFFDTDGPSIVWRPKYVEVLEDGSWSLELKMAEKDLRRFLKHENLAEEQLVPVSMNPSAPAANE